MIAPSVLRWRCETSTTCTRPRASLEGPSIASIPGSPCSSHKSPFFCSDCFNTCSRVRQSKHGKLETPLHQHCEAEVGRAPWKEILFTTILAPMWEPSCHHAPPCSASKESMLCCEPRMHVGNAFLQTHVGCRPVCMDSLLHRNSSSCHDGSVYDWYRLQHTNRMHIRETGR